MIRLSIPVRQALARLTLPVLMVAAFGLMLLGKADTMLAERARVALSDVLAPIYGVLATPLDTMRQAVGTADELLSLRSENARLREENERLQKWQAVASALDAENVTLRNNLRWLPEPTPSFVTARVVADAGGVYARAVLLSTGPNHGIGRGQIAIDEAGLVGRVTEVGARSARVLLLTDMNSRVPVTLETRRGRAMLVGTNTARPRLMYVPAGSVPAEGERVVTSGEANVFPSGLPVGVIRYNAGNVPEVELFAHLDRLEIVRVLNYGANGLAGPDQLARGTDLRPRESKFPEQMPASARRDPRAYDGGRPTPGRN